MMILHNKLFLSLGIILSLFLFGNLTLFAIPKSASLTSISTTETLPLFQEFLKEYGSREELDDLKKKVLELKGKAVPTLTAVMKESRFPDRNRWMATFLLGRITGKASAPFLSKFLEHPNWVLRLASLKTLLALSAVDYGELYAKKLTDESLMVRTQALSNIRELKLSQYSSDVWRMLYQRQNYQEVKGKMKRTAIIEEVIKAVGDLGHQKATSHLLTMIQKRNYADIFPAIDYSLQKITGKESPVGDYNIKKLFWSKFALQDKKF